jgi:hypothetical protein
MARLFHLVAHFSYPYLTLFSYPCFFFMLFLIVFYFCLLVWIQLDMTAAIMSHNHWAYSWVTLACFSCIASQQTILDKTIRSSVQLYSWTLAPGMHLTLGYYLKTIYIYIYIYFFFFWWYWGLNLGLCALPLEPCLQSLYIILDKPGTSQLLMAHACNPSYSGGWDQVDYGLRASPDKWFARSHLQNKQSKMNCRCGSRGRVSALQAWSSEPSPTKTNKNQVHSGQDEVIFVLPHK